MKETILLIAGISILLLTWIDLFLTIIHIGNKSVFSKRISKGVWLIFYNLAGRNPRAKALDFVGGVILFSLIFSWILLLWTGFSLIYISENDSVVDTSSGSPADIIGKIYYVGYNITSLGNGDLKSGSNSWRLASNVMGMLCMVFVTLGVSYLLPILEAVTHKRILAAYISKLGSSPTEIIESSYDGRGFENLYSKFSSLESMIFKLSEQHYAYPILHYFHATQRKFCSPIAITVLDEVVTILEVYQLYDSKHALYLKTMRGAIDEYIAKVSSKGPNTDSEVPEFPYYAELQKIIVQPLVENEEILKRFEKRRQLLNKLIKKDGWKWKDIHQPF